LDQFELWHAHPAGEYKLEARATLEITHQRETCSLLDFDLWVEARSNIPGHKKAHPKMGFNVSS